MSVSSQEKQRAKATEKRKEGGVAETVRVVVHALIIAVRDPHLPVPAVQHPVRLDDGDAADRRLPVRLEIHLRLQPLFAAVLAAAVLRPHLRLRRRSAATSWCSACRRTTATDYIKRVIGLPGDTHPDDRRRAQHQRRAGQARARRRLRRRTEDGGGIERIKRWKETLPNGVELSTRSICSGQRVPRQHAGLHGAAPATIS